MEFSPPITREQISEAIQSGHSVFVNIADLQDPSDPSGRSYRQVNAEKKHAIPIGALVEVADTGERLYVMAHHRDCDQTPLYGLTMHDYLNETNELIRASRCFGGHGEEGLTVIRPPDQPEGNV